MKPRVSMYICTIYGIHVLHIYTSCVYIAHITSTHDIYTYTVHNTTHTVYCTYKINHVKDKYMYTIQCTMYIQPARYPASFISYVLCVCLYDLFLAPGASCYQHCTACYIIQFARFAKNRIKLSKNGTSL